MSAQTISQILRCLTLGRYTAHVEDGELKIRGPQPLAGPLPASIKARRGEIVDFLLHRCGGVWPAAEGSELYSMREQRKKRRRRLPWLAEVVGDDVECGEEGVHVEHESSVPFPSGSVSKPTLICGHLPLNFRPSNSHQAFEKAIAAERRAYEKAMQPLLKARERRQHIEALSRWVRTTPLVFSPPSDATVPAAFANLGEDAGRAERQLAELQEREAEERAENERRARATLAREEGAA